MATVYCPTQPQVRAIVPNPRINSFYQLMNSVNKKLDTVVGDLDSLKADVKKIKKDVKNIKSEQSYTALRLYNSIHSSALICLPFPRKTNRTVHPGANNPFPVRVSDITKMNRARVTEWLMVYDQPCERNEDVELLRTRFAFFIGANGYDEGVNKDILQERSAGGGPEDGDDDDDDGEEDENNEDEDEESGGETRGTHIFGGGRDRGNQRGRGQGRLVNRRNDAAGGANAGGAVAGPSGVASGNEHESSSLSPPPSLSQHNAPQTGSKRSRPTGANERPRKKAKNQNERPGRKSMRLEEQSRASTPGSILT